MPRLAVKCFSLELFNVEGSFRNTIAIKLERLTAMTDVSHYNRIQMTVSCPAFPQMLIPE